MAILDNTCFHQLCVCAHCNSIPETAAASGCTKQMSSDRVSDTWNSTHPVNFQNEITRCWLGTTKSKILTLNTLILLHSSSTSIRENHLAIRSLAYFNCDTWQFSAKIDLKTNCRHLAIIPAWQSEEQFLSCAFSFSFYFSLPLSRSFNRGKGKSHHRIYW